MVQGVKRAGSRGAGMGGEAWYVLQSKPHKENQLHAYLQTQGITTFYPTVRVNPVNPRARKIRPYFPRYMFVHIDLGQTGVSTFAWAPGAIRLVEFDGIPASVPEAVIYQLKQQLENIEAAGGMLFDGLRHGDPVHIVNGPLAGYDAIFDLRLGGSERVQVLLEILGRVTRVKLNVNAIEKKRTR